MALLTQKSGCRLILAVMVGIIGQGAAPSGAWAAEAAPSSTMPAAEAGHSTDGVRLKDLCEIEGVRENQINGVGVVIGLSGTGDKAPGALRMIRQFIDKKRIALSEADLAAKNVALVTVTSDLPPFKRPGDRIANTMVACVNDATSLRGGILIQTALTPGTSETVYAVAQGPVSVGGFGNAGPSLAGGGTGHTNIETVGTIAQGAIVEREVPMSLLFQDRLQLVLRNPDFATASRVARILKGSFGADRVVAADAGRIALLFQGKPTETDLVDTIAKVMDLRVDPDMKARVVINARTGTVVAGRDVRISPVAVSHGGLSLRIQPKQVAVAGTAGNATTTAVQWIDPATNFKTTNPPAGTKPGLVPGSMSVLEGATVEDIANGLNALGARPRDLVAIFQALVGAGALHAELVEM